MHRQITRLVAVLASVGLLGLSSINARPTAQAAASNKGSGSDIVVKLIRSSDLPAIAAEYGLDPMPLDWFLSEPLYRLKIADGSSPKDKSDELLEDPQGRVIYAEPNHVSQAPESRARVTWSVGGNAGDYVAQWAPDKIRLPEAHMFTRGAGITVAVLDTGVDFSHPALAGRLVPGYDFVDNDTNPSEVGNHTQNPAFGHGTHVAGLVALAAPDVKIMPLRVLDKNGVGDVWRLAKALAFAMNPDGNLATDDGAQVINLSLSTVERSDLLRDAIKAAICNDGNQNQASDDLPCFSRRGAVIAAAAGNSASQEREYPAGDGRNGMISVGASTQSDTKASFSNFGSWVMVLAPGEGILSSVPGGLYGTWSGTSMATPLVAGEAALVRAWFPSLKPAKVAQRIVDSSREIRGPVRRRIDAAAALSANSSH